MKKSAALMLPAVCLFLVLCASVQAGRSGIWKPADDSNSFYIQTYSAGSCVVIVSPDGRNFFVFLEGECNEGVGAFEYFGGPAALDLVFTSDETATADLIIEGEVTQYALSKTFDGDCRNADGDRDVLTNSLDMNFVYIPSGRFSMGSPESEPFRRPIETLHLVTLTKGFYMQTTEVTQGQWKAVMGSNPSGFDICGDDCPVENVSWGDVQAFIDQLNAMGEGTYRLPTEAEWEYAARAGSALGFANGEITVEDCAFDPILEDMGWYCLNSGEATHPVAQKDPNPWGLYDMHGNVWEWVQDWYGEYPTGSVTDPTGPFTGENRVLRGGSWFDGARSCRSALRGRYDPAGRRNGDFGFRLARSQAGPVVAAERHPGKIAATDEAKRSEAEAERGEAGAKE